MMFYDRLKSALLVDRLRKCVTECLSVLSP